MANQDDGFLREVEEELRRERLEKIWREYGTYILIVAGLIVFGVLGYKYMEDRRISEAQETGLRYEEAMALVGEGKEGSAAKEFETIASDGTGGYRSLAQLQYAGALLKEGKRAEALAAFEELGKTGGDELLRSYAKLQAASLQLGQADFTEMQNRLTPLMDDNSPWRYSARELLGLAAFKSGKSEEARSILAPLLVDQKTPQTIIARTQIVLAEIAEAQTGAKADNKAESAPAAPAAAATAADDAASGDDAKPESTKE
jgi:hypothetical protein